jgi:hypothetical protein
MTRENKPEAATEARNEYAFWAIPGAAATVTYSLPLFHEIDFAVNEGYRKIPHGGIEEGGLLFGVIDEKGVRVEAFRPIACEHASGPSFLLSDRDLEVLHSQIENAASDPELVGLHVVGLFLAHTRSPLTLTDREADLCRNADGAGQAGALSADPVWLPRAPQRWLTSQGRGGERDYFASAGTNCPIRRWPSPVYSCARAEFILGSTAGGIRRICHAASRRRSRA